MLVVKQFGCNRGSIIVGNAGRRLELKICRNTGLNFFMTKNVAYVYGIYSFISELQLKSYIKVRLL